MSQSKKHNLRRLYLPRVPLRAWLGLVLLAAAALTPHSSTAASPDYLREIKPLLAPKCYPCHGALKQKANLRLDTVQLMLKGGKSGVTHGATDELGFHAVENRHYVTAIHATVLQQLGINPHTLEIPDQKRLEIYFGAPIREIIA